MSDKKFPKVGIGVFVIKDGKILMHERFGSHGEHTWSLPGGHLEFGEGIEDGARREVKEESDIEIKNIRFGPYTNDVFKKENKHYVTLFVVAEYDSGEVKIMEPDRCLRWQWCDWNDLPRPLFLPIENLLKTDFNPTKY